jgi:hypothetical protein
LMLRLINAQGLAGLAASLALLGLLLVQKGETHRWRKQSAQFEQLYRGEQAALAGTVANYRAAAEAARSADRAAVERAHAAQAAINDRSEHEYETRLADARTRAFRLRDEGADAATDSGRGRATRVPHLSAAPGSAAEAADQDGLPSKDALTATEQAIQLDELIRWVRLQAAVDPNAGARR